MFVIDEVNIPYSWNTVEKDINDKLYVGWVSSGGGSTYNMLTLPSKRYTGTELASQMQTLLNAIGGGSSSWTVSYDYVVNNITISSANPFLKILTDADLKISSAFTDEFRQNPKSINEILQIEGFSLSGFYNNAGYPFTTGFLNLLNYQDLYITSASMGSFDSQGPRGESTIIRKVSVNTAWGFSIIDKIGDVKSDGMSCSKLSLSTIDFQLRDVKGRIVPLHGANLSFVVKFSVE